MNAFSYLGQAKAAKRTKAFTGMQVTNDPYRKYSARTGEHDKLFEGMKVGQALKCESERTGRISEALRRWAARKGRHEVKVASVADYGDGFGRVWLLEKGKHGKE